MNSIKDLLKQSPVFVVDHNCTVYEAVLHMAEKGIGLVPVIREGKVVGVFSERDLVKRVIAEGKDIRTTRVDEVMTAELITAAPDEPYQSILRKMSGSRIRHILVIENNKLAGVISMRDLLELDVCAQKETVEALNHYIYSKYSYDIETNQ